MDPQATIKRIMDAREANDADELESAMTDLWEWLERGGFPPVVKSIGVYPGGHAVKWIGALGALVIQTVHPDSVHSGFEMCRYTFDGKLIKRHSLA